MKTFLKSTILLVSAMLFSGSPRITVAQTSDVTKEGPYPVGVTTTTLVDSSRTDHFTKKPRTLITEIWYPATDAAKSLPVSKYSDFLPQGDSPELEASTKKTLGVSVSELNAGYWMKSHRNAEIRMGKYPVIFFSHGNGGSRTQNTFWCDYLASHGYIIVAADHTGNARVTFLKEGPVVYQNSERMNSYADRPKDMIFLLDQMVKWNAGDGDPRFKGSMELSHICVSGMSFGSMTAIQVASMEKRFTCVIAMSGAYPNSDPPKVPTLYMLGTEDRTIGLEGNKVVQELQAKQKEPSYLLELKNGGHYSFTDMFKMNKNFGDGVGKGKRRDGGADFDFTNMETTYNIVNSYSLAFLNLYMKGDKTAVAYLKENHWPTELILK